MRRDDPFDDFFQELERMMNQMMGDSVAVEGAAGGTEVHLDVHETDEEVRVVADLPGVEKEAIDLRCDGTVLTVEAGGDRREYRERVDLPARVDEHSADASYNNGVLEVTFDRAEDAQDISLS
jgi:HSP20 family protein